MEAKIKLPEGAYAALEGLKAQARDLGSNGTESALKPYQRRSVPSSQASCHFQKSIALLSRPAPHPLASSSRKKSTGWALLGHCANYLLRQRTV